jgi:hypothetical protein
MPSRLRFAASVAAIAVAMAGLAACDSAPERSSSRFCSELDRQLPGLEGPTATQADQDALLARYEQLSEITPLAVEDDWQQLTELVRTAVTVVPSDPESVQKLADESYATERAYRRIFDWVTATCGVTMPQPGGIETTTVAPPPDSTPAP